MATYTPAVSGTLSENDYIWCFKIAGVIWDQVSSASIHDGFGQQLNLPDLGILQADLRARLKSLDSQTIVHVQDCITQWVPVEFATAKMTSGAVGDTTGLDYNPKEKREAIKQTFGALTGCLGIYQAQMLKSKAMNGEMADNGLIGVRRG